MRPARSDAAAEAGARAADRFRSCAYQQACSLRIRAGGMSGSPDASSAAPSGTTEAGCAASPALSAGGAQKCNSELAATVQQQQQEEEEDGVVAIARAAPRRKSRAAQLEESKLLSKRHWRLAQLVHGGDEGARAAGACTPRFILYLGCDEAEIVQGPKMRPATARMR